MGGLEPEATTTSTTTATTSTTDNNEQFDTNTNTNTPITTPNTKSSEVGPSTPQLQLEPVVDDYEDSQESMRCGNMRR